MSSDDLYPNHNRLKTAWTYRISTGLDLQWQSSSWWCSVYPSFRAKSPALRLVYLSSILKSLCPVMVATSITFKSFSNNREVASCPRSWNVRSCIPARTLARCHRLLRASTWIGNTLSSTERRTGRPARGSRALLEREKFSPPHACPNDKEEDGLQPKVRGIGCCL